MPQERNGYKNEKILLVLVPAFIGTLNVPGGAILSAPIVDEIGNNIELNPDRKTVVNLMYRHVFFYIYPLYTPYILANKLAGLSKSALILFNFPVFLIGLVVSYYILFKDKTNSIEKKSKNTKEDYLNILQGIMPITIILILLLVFNISFPLSVLAALFTAIILNIKDDFFRRCFQRIRRTIIKGFKYNLTIVIVGIMFFRDLMQNTNLMNDLAEILTLIGIPTWLLVIVLSFLTSFFSGYHLASIGLVLPIFLPIIPSILYIPYIGLMFTGAIIGYWISPIHLCLVLTKEYFEANIINVYKFMMWPLISIFISSTVMFLIYTSITHL